MDNEDRENTANRPWKMARPILVITGHRGNFVDFVPHTIYHANHHILVKLWECAFIREGVIYYNEYSMFCKFQSCPDSYIKFVLLICY